VFGQQRRYAHGRSQFLHPLMLAFAVGVALMSLWAIADWQIYQHYQRQGVRVEGVVVSREQGWFRYNVTYAFMSDGQRYQHTTWVDYDVFERAMQNSAFIVIYPPNLPTFARLAVNHYPPSHTMITAMCLNALAVISVVAYFAQRKGRRVLEQQGQLLAGQVSAAQGSAHSGTYQIMIHYVFKDPQGNTISAKANRARPDLSDDTLPIPRTPVWVLYLNNAHYELL
jgi:hypothetical protein